MSIIIDSNNSQVTVSSQTEPGSPVSDVAHRQLGELRDSLQLNRSLKNRCADISKGCLILALVSAGAGAATLNPLFLVVAAGFLFGCLVAAVFTYLSEKNCQEDSSHIQKLQANPQDNNAVRKTADDYLKSDEAIASEKTYSTSELVKFVDKNRFVEAHVTRPCEILGTEIPLNDQSFLPYFVSNILGVSNQDALERFKECIAGNHGAELQEKAFQLSAFLVMLGDGDEPLPARLNETLAAQGGIVEEQLDPGMVTIEKMPDGKGAAEFHVSREAYGLNKNPYIAKYLTSRTITVSPHTPEGVKINITRTFYR